jgi:FAD/FMN-containing dehydrogenase
LIVSTWFCIFFFHAINLNYSTTLIALWTCVEQVVKIVALATRYQFVIIPFGGGTSVSGSITCPAREPRPIVALDTSEMNSILWIDRHQLLARVQVSTS